MMSDHMRNLKFYQPLEVGIISRVQEVEKRINEPEDRTIGELDLNNELINRLKK